MTIEATPLPTTRPTPFDPPEDYRKLREDQPVSRLAMPDGSLGWLVTSYELVRFVMADPRFSSRPINITNPLRVIPEDMRQDVNPGMFIGMDPPDHGRYRRLLTGQFTVRRMRALEPRIQQMVIDHLDAMETAGNSADLVEKFALPIPSLVICELLGVPYEEREEFQARSSRLLDTSLPFEEARRAGEAIREYVGGLVARKRAEPGDDMISGLFESDPTLTDDEVAEMGLLLLIAGHETTANMLGLGTFLLLQRPDQLAKLREDPSLVNNAVEELLRYLSVVQFGTMRGVLEDVEVGGQQFRKGETVICSLAAANRDPARFDNPEILDITRTHSTHVAFGHGIHQCLGQQLSRVEMQIAFRELFARFPNLRLAVEPGEVKLRDTSVVYGAASLPVAW
ncbi:cytochrome P450 [Kutzneria kofuensis]|uniref:Cytochrome P450 n=1 Tax=Kutzneria kofuensis TaxID=103725 RepID=A0A7W9NHB7_9PSEU|nr:cytochrome P450 [Kutzneria kofuensis]MBB5893392.1 cytochrome P450 [Kutzneria kofuensis]